MKNIDLGRKVDYQTLETALLGAAKEVGWRAKISKRDHIDIDLKGWIFPAMRVTIHDKQPTEHLFIWNDCYCGYASDKKIQRYLDAVTKNLECS